MTVSEAVLSFPAPRILFVTPADPKAPPPEGARRPLNLLVAAVGLACAAPLMALIAIVIKLTSRGPVFFVQTRIGMDRRDPRRPGVYNRRREDLGGKPFRIYKFRTMQVQAPGAQQVWASQDDPRITPVGRVLRKSRLDELPQLLNVLRGDMNVVGPRPEQPKIVAELRDQIRRYQRRHLVRPGITGWAQVNQHYDQTVEDVRRKVSYDMDYIRRQSLVEDVRIMLRTVPAVVLRKGGW